jgi:FkbM family methyltransferase
MTTDARADTAAWQRHRDQLEHDNIRLILAAVLAPHDCCVDIGAYKGDILRTIVRCAPLGRHIAFEPTETRHAALVAEFPTVDVRRAAVGAHRGHAEFVEVLDESAFSGLRPVPNHRGRPVRRLTVPVEDLDSALPAGYVPAVIKIDVEGAEYAVLSGARATLRKHRPLVIVEFARDAAMAYGTTAHDMFGLLHLDAGLRIFDVEGRGPYDRAGFRRTFEQRLVENYIARV